MMQHPQPEGAQRAVKTTMFQFITATAHPMRCVLYNNAVQSLKSMGVHRHGLYKGGPNYIYGSLWLQRWYNIRYTMP